MSLACFGCLLALDYMENKHNHARQIVVILSTLQLSGSNYSRRLLAFDTIAFTLSSSIYAVFTSLSTLGRTAKLEIESLQVMDSKRVASTQSVTEDSDSLSCWRRTCLSQI